ncbi:MAG: iron ABC transporter permease [Neomegalonema sp.]|nr:iron ABC transporter permease [Neomegalonema sp.]
MTTNDIAGAPPRAQRLKRLDGGVAIAAAALCATLFAFAGILLGPSGLSLERMAVALGDALRGAPASDAAASAILLHIRLPRIFLAAMVGAGLAMSGAGLQGLFRNPLADPGLIGVTAGAAVGAISIIVLGDALLDDAPRWLRPYLMPLFAFCGALLMTAIIFRVARVRGELSVATLLLAGVALGAIAAAIIGVMVYLSDDQQLRDLTFWTMGGFAGGGWLAAMILTPVMIAGGIWMARFGRALDLLQLGERAAYHSGVDVERVKWRVGAVSALMVGAATAFAGPVGFIGLVAPHLARLIAPPHGRILIPLSALIGAALALGADLAVRLVAPPAEPPVGLATSLIGGPFFLWLLINRARQGGV